MEVGAATALAVVNIQGWEVLRIQPVSGRGRGEAACRSWGACPGRSANRKVVEEVEGEEEGRRWWEQRRRGPGIPGKLSSKISHRPLLHSPRQLLPKLLWCLRPFITKSNGGSCVPCTHSITSSRMGQPSAETPCRRSTRGETVCGLKVLRCA